MSLPDLLQWLAGASKTGTLVLTNGRFRKQLDFQGGVITASSSDDPREFLGQFLLAHRKISEEQLRKAMESQRSTGVMLGKILVMVGALTEEDLKSLLTRKAEESIFNLFLWKDGSFTFDDEAEAGQDPFPLTLRVEDVLMEGVRRYDELQAILQAFSSGDFVLETTGQALPEKLAASQEVRRLMEVVDGKRTLTDLCLELHASEFRISRIAYELYRQKCLRVVKAADGPGDSGAPVDTAEALASRARQALEAHKYEQALDLLAQAVERRPSDPALRQQLDDTERSFIERAYQHYMPPDRVPVLRMRIEEMTGETLTPQEVFLVSRINGSWTVKDIVTISPMREVESLRVLKDLRSRGLIDLIGG